MIRDITLGQYYPVKSVLHQMDPRTKLFGTMVFIISLFLADNLFRRRYAHGDPSLQTSVL